MLQTSCTGLCPQHATRVHLAEAALGSVKRDLGEFEVWHIHKLKSRWWNSTSGSQASSTTFRHRMVSLGRRSFSYIRFILLHFPSLVISWAFKSHSEMCILFFTSCCLPRKTLSNSCSIFWSCFLQLSNTWNICRLKPWHFEWRSLHHGK